MKMIKVNKISNLLSIEDSLITYKFGRSCIFKHDDDVASNKKLLAKIKC